MPGFGCETLRLAALVFYRNCIILGDPHVSIPADESTPVRVREPEPGQQVDVGYFDEFGFRLGLALASEGQARNRIQVGKVSLLSVLKHVLLVIFTTTLPSDFLRVSCCVRTSDGQRFLSHGRAWTIHILCKSRHVCCPCRQLSCGWR